MKNKHKTSKKEEGTKTNTKKTRQTTKDNKNMKK